MKKTLIKTSEIRSKALKYTDEIFRIFNNLDIPLWLDFGTLLGAYRDKTILPWEGEIDLSTFQKFRSKKIISELHKAGFITWHGIDRIKMRHKDWKYGSFIFDLHFYKEYDTKYGCSFSERVKNLFIIRRLQDICSYYIHPDHYKYKDIIKTISANDIDIGKIKEFNFQENKKNNIYSLEIENKKIFHNPEQVIKNPITKILNRLISILPVQLNTKIYRYTKNKIKNTKITSKTITTDKHIFDNLIKFNLLGITVNIPKETEQYLRNTYGKDWNIVKRNWNRNELHSLEYI